MDTFKRPVVLLRQGVDGRAAVTRAAAIARAGGGELTLLQVREEVPVGFKLVYPPEVFAGLEATLRRRDEEQRAAMAAVAESAGVAAHSVVREGRPFLVAVRCVIEEGHDLLLTPAGGGEEEVGVFSATDRHLLRKCPCPVWLVAPRSADTLRRVVAAVDPDEDDAEQYRLSRDVLVAAAGVAAADGAALDVVHAWHLFGESILRGPRVAVSDPEVEQLAGATLNRHARALDRLVDSMPARVPEPRRHLVRGVPADVIARVVKDEGADLLVMGTVGRSGVPGLLIGNTAERVVDAVACSILALKPAGFLSPVVPEGT